MGLFSNCDTKQIMKHIFAFIAVNEEIVWKFISLFYETNDAVVLDSYF